MTKNEIRKGTISRRAGRTRFFGHHFEHEGQVFRKKGQSSEVWVISPTDTRSIGVCFNLAMFVDAVYKYISERNILGGALAGGAEYNALRFTVDNGRGDILLRIEEPEGLGKRETERYMDDLGEAVAKALNAALTEMKNCRLE